MSKYTPTWVIITTFLIALALPLTMCVDGARASHVQQMEMSDGNPIYVIEAFERGDDCGMQTILPELAKVFNAYVHGDLTDDGWIAAATTILLEAGEYPPAVVEFVSMGVASCGVKGVDAEDRTKS